MPFLYLQSCMCIEILHRVGICGPMATTAAAVGQAHSFTPPLTRATGRQRRVLRGSGQNFHRAHELQVTLLLQYWWLLVPASSLHTAPYSCIKTVYRHALRDAPTTIYTGGMSDSQNVFSRSRSSIAYSCLYTGTESPSPVPRGTSSLCAPRQPSLRGAPYGVRTRRPYIWVTYSKQVHRSRLSKHLKANWTSSSASPTEVRPTSANMWACGGSATR